MRAFLETPDGQIHYRVDGVGEPPLLLLHPIPRSMDVFADVIPIFSQRRRVIAMDTIGYGDSDKPSKWYTVEDYAANAIMLLDTLDIKKAIVVGSHTGSKIAIEMAVAYPERIDRIVLLGPYLWKEDNKQRGVSQKGRYNEIKVKEDGSHLVEIWQHAVSMMEGGVDLGLVSRRVLDILKAGDMVHRGHRASAQYPQAERLPLIKCPTLIVWGTKDLELHERWGFHTHNLAEAIPKCKVAKIKDGTIATANQRPEEFARLVLDFIEEQI